MFLSSLHCTVLYSWGLLITFVELQRATPSLQSATADLELEPWTGASVFLIYSNNICYITLRFGSRKSCQYCDIWSYNNMWSGWWIPASRRDYYFQNSWEWRHDSLPKVWYPFIALAMKMKALFSTKLWYSGTRLQHSTVIHKTAIRIFITVKTTNHTKGRCLFINT